MAERFCSIQKAFFYDTKPEETQGHLLQNSLTTMLIGHWTSNNIIDAESCNLLGKNASNVFSCKGSFERGNDLPVKHISLLMDCFSFERPVGPGPYKVKCLHIRNHKDKSCKEKYSPATLKEELLEGNTMAAKQTFVWLSRFKIIVCAMPKVSSEQTKEDLKVARMLNVLTKARPSQNIRDLYRYKCGYGPCVIIQKDMLLQGSADECQLRFPAFYELMRDLEIRRGENTAEIDLVPSSDYLFVPGDIVAVNPGTDNGIPSSDKWWLLQVNKPHASSRDRPGCQIFGFWLNEHTSDESTSGKHFTLLPDSVKVYFGSIIQDNKIPVVVPVEELNSDWQNGHVVYTFTNEYCNKLDELSNAFRRELNLVESGVEESDVDSDSDDDDGQQSHIHEVELTAMQHRRRMMRNVEGQVLTSYRELSNPRPARQRQRHLQHLAHTERELEAERNCPEFDDHTGDTEET
ncbi:hypothetical protein OS493_000904 [Desmophyllum pertusum]|uniref:Uncharacterized protein n=1 Tax=Desmophyllum pertusum TaxID=174260 RepID=A0A9X0D5F9_9CNID|nr:hypothetical protein OS493_000904 [Desmophyllum pertusum]